MFRKILVSSACVAVTGATFLVAQELPKKSVQPAAAQQPTTATAPPLPKDARVKEKAARDKDAKTGQDPIEVEKTVVHRSDSPINQRMADHLMASCVALGNQEEIAISDIGRNKAQNEEVKKFAAMMKSEHHEFLTKLAKFAPEATKADFLIIENEARTVRSVEVGPARTKAQIKQAAASEAAAATDADKRTTVENAVARSNDEVHGGFNHMQIQRELAAQSLASTREILEKKSGAEFDKCFIGTQLAMHKGMNDKLIVFQRHASPELAAVLAEGQKTTEHHMARAEELMKDLHHGATTVETKREGKNGLVKERKVIKEE